MFAPWELQLLTSPRKIYSFVIETIVLLSSAYLLDDQELSPILVIGHWRLLLINALTVIFEKIIKREITYLRHFFARLQIVFPWIRAHVQITAPPQISIHHLDCNFQKAPPQIYAPPLLPHFVKIVGIQWKPVSIAASFNYNFLDFTYSGISAGE